MATSRSPAVQALLKLAFRAKWGPMTPGLKTAAQAAWEAFGEEETLLTEAEGAILGALMLRVEGLL